MNDFWMNPSRFHANFGCKIVVNLRLYIHHMKEKYMCPQFGTTIFVEFYEVFIHSLIHNVQLCA